MNILRCFLCDTCGTYIDCRIGMSNREVQSFQFACPKCEERISFVLGQDDAELKGATDILEFAAPFTGDNPFVDLHLDFPAYFGKYELGETTFLRVVRQIGHEGYSHLQRRLDVLNRLHPLQRDLQRLITQYKRGDIRNFERVCSKIPLVKLRSDKKEDVISALYCATSIMSSPFTIHEENEEVSDGFLGMYAILDRKSKANTILFIDTILDNNFLKNLHYDCLSLYPKLVELDVPFRPAFFYDYVDKSEYSAIPARVSTADFDSCNSFYKDLAEVFSRQLTLLAGINNLLKRGDANEFEPSLKINKRQLPRKEVESLNSFADVDLGNKIQFIDDSIYTINLESIDNRLRNGIAHFKYEYKESVQMITYYPMKEGMNREKYHEISFIEFIRKTLLLFREVHNLNHLIKTTLYYSILMLKKDL